MGDVGNSENSTPPTTTPLTTPRMETTRRTISPYDLTAGDNPGTVISRPPLRGPNYDEWAANIRLALRARKKFGFTDGTIQQPSQDSEDYEDWCANNALVVSWIKITIDETLSSSIPHNDIASELWSQLQRRFVVKNGQRVQRLKAELANCRQHGSAIEAYYGKLTKLWTTLSDYQQGTTIEEIAREREEDKLHQFLMGLDDTIYSSVKSSLLSRTPLPTVEEAYNVVSQDEESRSISRIYEPQNHGASLAIQTEGRLQRNRLKVSCTLCGRNGHNAENCFKKIGYPEWWGDRFRPKPTSSTGNSSSGFSQKNTSASFLKPKIESAHVNHVLTTSATNDNTISEADRTGLTGLTDQQWKTLVDLLNHKNSGVADKFTGTVFFESWIIDTGASHHMTGYVESLSDLRDISPIYIKLPDRRFTTATRQGGIRLGSYLSLQHVLFVDGLECHLISVSQLTKDRCCIIQFTDKMCVMQDRITQTLIGSGKEENGLYFFRAVEAASMTQRANTTSLDVWHQRLGHASTKVIKSLKLCDNSVGNSLFENKACDVCIRAKHHRDVFPTSENKTSFSFQLIHCDLWGPYRTPTQCGSRYFLTILDDFSRAVWLYLLPSKEQAPTQLKNFIALVERQFNQQVKTVRSDNGSEFLCLTDFFRQKGKEHETSCVGTPQQNGRVERKHQHILNIARALRFQAELPIEFWGYCVLMAACLINRTPTSILKGKSPFEMLYNEPPSLNHLRILGCLCYVHDQRRDGDKFASRSKKAVFIGYPHGKKGWRIYEIDTGKISVSRDIIFIETEFPFAKKTPQPVIHEEEVPTVFIDDDIMNSTQQVVHAEDRLIPNQDPQIPENTELLITENIVSTTSIPTADSSDTAETSTAHESRSHTTTSAVDESELVVDTATTRRSTRTRQPPTKLADYVTNLLYEPYPSVTPYPIDNYVSSSQFSSHYQGFLSAITAANEPSSY